MYIPESNDLLPQKNRPVIQYLSRLFLSKGDWNFKGEFPQIPKFVMIFGPHTSNWDTVYLMTAIGASGLNVSFLAKKQAFKGPLGSLLRSFGGIPVDRSKASGVVEQMVQQFQQQKSFILGMAPEGTRKAVHKWRSGFYNIAHGAGVPIVAAGLDFGSKQIILSEPMTTSGNWEADLPSYQQFFNLMKGKKTV